MYLVLDLTIHIIAVLEHSQLISEINTKGWISKQKAISDDNHMDERRLEIQEDD